MNENNIEEDMKILEELKETYRFLISFRTKEIPADKKLTERIQAIEHILSDYKRVLKENEELNDKYATFVKMSSEVIANSIPIQKIKDKTEDLKKEYKMELEKNSIKAFILKCQIKALQELSKGENDERI